MNNTELDNKIKELIAIENFCEYSLAVKQFEKEYKKTIFFKQTKMPLKTLLAEAKMHYFFNLTNFDRKIQKTIDGLSVEKIQNILDDITNVFAAENKEIAEFIKDFSEK